MASAAVATVEAVRACLPGFELVPGATRRRVVTWLDTADWRLHRKGLSCELVRTASGSSVALHDPDGPRLECALAPGTQAPLRLELVPDGPLRRRLAPVVGTRALLPLVESRRSVRELRVLDGQAKTVVRLLAEGPAAVTGVREGTVASRLNVVPVRGYGREALWVSGALRQGGLLSDDAPPSEAVQALEAGGLSPGVLPGVLDPRPVPQTPAAVAVAIVLQSFLDQIEANVPGTIDDLDVEFLHDLRIAVRRSRSALKLAGDVLPPGTPEGFAPELKWLGDVTTPVRDLDVHLLGLPGMADRLTAFAPQDLDPFGAHLARHRVGEQRALVRALTSRRYQRFVTGWRALLAEAAAGDTGARVGVRAGELAAARVARADRRVVKLGTRITPESPAEDLHTLRKRAKELRYTVDVFATVLDAAHVKGLVSELKALQDVLGAFQDSEVQREALRTFAAEMVSEQSARRHVPVDTLLALGELAAHLEEDQRRAREAFDDRFAHFMDPDVRRHVRALSSAPEGAS